MSNRTIIGLRKNFLILSALLLIAAVLFAVAYNCSAGVAFAEDTPSDDDTFSVIFPTARYIQSEDPTLVAANANYLIVYDKTASALFVRGGGRMDTYEFPLNIQNVEYIKAVGNTAFIHAEGQNYTVDLKDTSARPIRRELSSPDNANYFRSDGTYLYAKNVYGSITIYDENLELAQFTVQDENGSHTVTVEDHNNPEFAGKQVLAGNNGLLYFLTFPRGLPYFIIYDPLTQKEIINKPIDRYVSEAYVGDNIVVAQVASNTSNPNEATALVGLDKANGQTLFASNIIPDSFCVYADKLYTIEGKQIITYTLESEEIDGQTVYKGFRKDATISMKGKDAYHLDAPSDIVKSGAEYAVADSNNKRVAFIGAAGIMDAAVEMNTVPVRLAADAMGVYVLSDDSSIVKIENNEVVQTLNAQNTEGAVDITYLDKLYILKEDGLYTAIGTRVFKLADIEGGRRIATAKDGANIYMLKDGAIGMYAKDGTLLNELSNDFTNVTDIAIDYTGKIFALGSEGFDVYENTLGTLNLLSKTEFSNRRYHVSASSVCLDGQSLFFTAKECLIGASKADSAVDKESFVPSAYTPDAQNGYSFAKLKEDVFSYVVPTDGRMEGITPAPADTVLVFDSEETAPLAYALLNGNFFQIQKKDFEAVETKTLSGDYATVDITTLYALPNVDSGKRSVAKDTRVALFADCADFENSKWTRVTYDEKVYFVNASDIDEYINVIPEKDRTYGKAKAKRVGGLVNVFSAASTDSEVLMQIVDGTKIEILEKLDGFYLIRYEDSVGYMQEHQVELEGLTTVQIVSIVVACVVAVAGIGVFIAIELAKKKAIRDERLKDKQK